ncbi:MAG: uncharacterized protein KVP18_001430 [Porospora cf. gigantea A]|uniref:uncharacterized protein n=1 Tax=Porospora cf. gigantea A TaxID=2853593 RepID=UPI00355A703C|nr:MAG: hypothetical protein KVP18_001430 [Porospora cf. gigantea A]
MVARLTIQQARRIFGTHKCQADILRELLAIPLPPGATMGDAYQNRRAATKARASRSRKLQHLPAKVGTPLKHQELVDPSSRRLDHTNEEDRKIFWDRPEVIREPMHFVAPPPYS